MHTLHDNFLRATAYIKVPLLGVQPRQCLDVAVRNYRGNVTDYQPLADLVATHSASANGAISSASTQHHWATGQGNGGANGMKNYGHKCLAASNIDLQVEAEEDDLPVTGVSLVPTGTQNESLETCIFDMFLQRNLPLDLETFIKYNEFSSIRIKADCIVNDVTQTAVKRANLIVYQGSDE